MCKPAGCRMQLQHFNRIAEAIMGLNAFPERVKLMESEPERMVGLRQLVVDNYSVFYVIENEKVIVTRVLYSTSNIEKRLLE